MKKIVVIAVALLLSYTLKAQVSLFDKYEDNDEVTSVIINKKAFSMLHKAAPDSQEGADFKRVVDGFNNMRIFTSEEPKMAAELRGTFDKYLKGSNLVELMRVNDKDAHVNIYVKEGKSDDYVTEFAMLVDEMNVGEINNREAELVIILITGNINLKDIAKITEDMNIPGNEHVKKTK
jgi:hypothetical protein